MKKLLFISSMLVFSIILTSSCTGDDDSHAESTIVFQGVLWSVDYSDKTPEQTAKSRAPETPIEPEDPAKTEDGYGYGDAIEKAYAELELVGEKSKLTEKARVEVSSIYAAQMLCYSQADEKIKARISGVTFDKVKDMIFYTCKSDMQNLGYNSAEEIPLTSISSVIKYFNSSRPDEPLEYELNFSKF